jgi:DNA-binding GntR family transcriptional regulator
MLRATSLAQSGRPDRAVQEIEAVVEAISRRDSRAATRLCAAHVRNAAKTGLTALERMTSLDEES